MSASDDAARALTDGWWPGEVTPLGDGHINDTWRVTSAAGEYVLQRINGRVFDAGAVLRNGVRVASHLASSDVPVLAPIASFGNPGYQSEAGESWRLTPYQPGQVYQASLDTLRQVEACGQAFGGFQAALADLPDTDLEPVIPGFLEFSRYLEQLDATLASMPRPLADIERALVEKSRDAHELAEALPRMHRAIHADCKINNLIFEADQVVAIVDLDTVMFGNPAWDWGDLVRSASLTDAGELMPERYAALVRGFSEHVSLDSEHWVSAPMYVAAMLCVRFLNDHLSGDRYFKVSKPGDNLERAVHQRSVLDQLRSQQGMLRRLSPG